MQHWDNLITTSSKVLVLGATNRPEDLDSAIQRRFERSFLLQMPDERTRVEILKIALKDMLVDKYLDYNELSRRMEGYSPSDIRSVCKTALAIPIREYRKLYLKYMSSNNNVNNVNVASNNKSKNETNDIQQHKDINKNKNHTTTSIQMSNTYMKVNVNVPHVSTATTTPPLPSQPVPIPVPIPPRLRAATFKDFEEALLAIVPTSWAAKTYASSQLRPDTNGYNTPHHPTIDPATGKSTWLWFDANNNNSNNSSGDSSHMDLDSNIDLDDDDDDDEDQTW
eukprot:gene3301-6535_t